MPTTLTVPTQLDETLAAMTASEPDGFTSLLPGDILSDDAEPTLNLWKITFDGC